MRPPICLHSESCHCKGTGIVGHRECTPTAPMLLIPYSDWMDHGRPATREQYFQRVEENKE